MSDLQSLITDILQFRDDRDWKQFHNAKDLALAIAIEAGELNELFLWKTADEANREKLKKELADVLIYAPCCWRILKGWTSFPSFAKSWKRIPGNIPSTKPKERQRNIMNFR
jgi:NTP pyrophosphatase (non-canonical NTP hydrolase)